MVNNAETTATNAEKKTTNDPGMCLQWSRERAAIGAYYGDAATAWRNTNDRHPGDRNPPRGSMAFWTGGSQGFGHVAPSVGGGQVEVRSTDSGGQGKVATVDVGWPERAWGMTYAGWAWDVNEVTIPHPSGQGDDMPTYHHAACSNDMAVQANEWLSIIWDNNITGDTLNETDKQFVIPGQIYNANLHATFTAPAGAVLRIRACEVVTATKETAEKDPMVDFVAVPGNNHVEYTYSGRVGADHGVVFRVSCDRPGAVLTYADVVLLTW